MILVKNTYFNKRHRILRCLLCIYWVFYKSIFEEIMKKLWFFSQGMEEMMSYFTQKDIREILKNMDLKEIIELMELCTKYNEKGKESDAS
ncbi:hypothetical protein DN393_30245 [Bacillus sp. BPN334]|nr:hypothetical protein DN393_30245 [Bacillus sp. BPN334]